MKTALILHSIKEADYCVEQRLHEGCLLLSTNPCVDVYLKERHGIECQCVSRYLTEEELAAQIKKASDAADPVLASLDEKIAPFLNEQFGLKMRYFAPAYSYLGKHYLLGMLAFIESLKKIVVAHHLDRIQVFNSRYQDFLNIEPDMAPLIARFFPQVACESIELPGNRSGEGGKFARMKRLLRKAGNPDVWRARFSKVARALRMNSRRRRPGAKSILLCEPLYFLGFLADSLPEYNLIHCTDEGYPAGFSRRTAEPEILLDQKRLELLPWGTREEPIEDFFLQNIREDFTKGIASRIRPALAVKKVHEKNPISLAVWGNIGGYPKYLLFEYLRSAGVKIVGAQHGNSYVDQIAPWAWESDFGRCDHFISWGFTKDDLARVYPDAKPLFEVHPLGSVLPEPAKSERLPIDVVFPMTWSMSLFDGGPARIKPDTLSDRQIKLLEHLDSIKGLSIYVKPPPGMTMDSCVAFSLSRRLNNLRIIENVPYLRFLGKYSPRMVIVDYPASPLYQSLTLDTEIILLRDFNTPYEKQAFDEVSRRAHYCEDTDAAIAKIDLFFAGRLEKKRDNAYYRHYIHQPNARENTLRLIRDLTDGRPA